MKIYVQRLSVALLKALAYLPFPVLYALSDLFYFLVFYLIGYRKKVVYQNLRNSFPEKTEEEVNAIAKKYYRHFCDITLETIKMNRLPIEKLKKHVRFDHVDRLNKNFEDGKGVLLLCFHYNNWEWNAGLSKHVKHEIYGVYSPLKSNPPMEDYMSKMRLQYGSTKVPMQNAPRASFTINKGPNYGMLWLAADQTPPSASQYWTTFLNQETPFFSGPQKIASKTNTPVFFHYIHKVKRGQYVADFFEISANRDGESEHDILLSYVDIIEQIIQKKPEYWLWSHRRWKHKRRENQQLIPRNEHSSFKKIVDEMIDEKNKIKSI